jgi:predicted nuclease of predicted toxin-antitoxin system
VIHGFTIISADSDFTTTLALSGAIAPSLVLLRSADRLAPEAQAALLAANLDAIVGELDQGAVVTIARGHMRVRRLPVK